MIPLRRTFLGSAVLALVVLASACTGGDDPATAGPVGPTPSGGGVVSEDAGDTAFLPGRFTYQFNSITAQASFEGSTATMTVRNGTGSELGAPSLYVVGVDDRRYDGTAEGAAPIADGEQVSLEFTFPDAVTPATIGLVVLSFGEDNVGAMPPVAAPTPEPSI